jgi:hypothetical protein
VDESEYVVTGGLDGLDCRLWSSCDAHASFEPSMPWDLSGSSGRPLATMVSLAGFCVKGLILGITSDGPVMRESYERDWTGGAVGFACCAEEEIEVRLPPVSSRTQSNPALRRRPLAKSTTSGGGRGRSRISQACKQASAPSMEDSKRPPPPMLMPAAHCCMAKLCLATRPASKSREETYVAQWRKHSAATGSLGWAPLARVPMQE